MFTQLREKLSDKLAQAQLALTGDDSDKQIAELVGKATSEELISPEWTLNMTLIDMVNQTPNPRCVCCVRTRRGYFRNISPMLLTAASCLPLCMHAMTTLMLEHASFGGEVESPLPMHGHCARCTASFQTSSSFGTLPPFTTPRPDPHRSAQPFPMHACAQPDGRQALQGAAEGHAEAQRQDAAPRHDGELGSWATGGGHAGRMDDG